ncbi:MAG TPA: STAS domain-containing protein [bacterium]|jgi:anti-sigma B factor antagonist|nr:STAS domain-containing protein [bacterium]
MERLALNSRGALSNNAVTVVDIEGVLDINTVSDFETLLQDLFKKKQYKLVLNMKQLTYISSAGFGVLMSIIKDVRKNKGDIKIVNVSSDIYKVFDLLELPGLFHILKTEQDAVGEF